MQVAAIVAGAGIWGCTVARRLAEAATIPNLVIGGCLGGYNYYDMDKSIEAVLRLNMI